MLCTLHFESEKNNFWWNFANIAIGSTAYSLISFTFQHLFFTNGKVFFFFLEIYARNKVIEDILFDRHCNQSYHVRWSLRSASHWEGTGNGDKADSQGDWSISVCGYIAQWCKHEPKQRREQCEQVRTVIKLTPQKISDERINISPSFYLIQVANYLGEFAW